MGLMDLLRVDRSFSNQPHGAGHYKLAQGNLLPNFGGDRWPVSAPAKRAETASPVAKATAPVREVAQGELPLASAAKSVFGQAAGKTVAAAPVAAKPAAAGPVQEARAGRPPVEGAKFTLGRFVRLILNR